MSFEPFDYEIAEGKQAVRLASASIEGGVMRVEVDCPRRKCDWLGFLIRYNHKIEADREAYLVMPDALSEGKKTTRMAFTLDLAAFPFRYTHWSIVCIYEKDGALLTARIAWKPKKKSAAEFILRDDNYKTPDGNIVFFYSQGGKYLGIRYRERSPYDTRTTRLKECAARAVHLVAGEHLRKRGITLLYEKRCEHAQDNGYHLFRYCMDNGMEDYLNRKIYYVISKDSVDRKKLARYRKNVLTFMSLKHLVYLQEAKLMLSPDSRAHAYVWQVQSSVIANRVKKIPHVFLGHGVLAMKRLNDSFTARRMKSVLCTVVSEHERRIFLEELGFKGTQLAITGYARFDALHDKSEGRREILVMPTHRSWLFGVEREVFLGSEYYRRYMELINSPHLIRQLEEHDLTLLFYLHPSIGEHVDAFTSTSDRVRIVPYGETPLDDLMMQCKLLVTDYSSVAWDVLFMGKPIVFYQYDLQDHLDTWGSYIDLATESPGARASDFEGLLEAIDMYIGNGFTLDPELAAKRDTYYRYLDAGNSRRICEEIKKRKL